MQRYTAYAYLETALHVSGVTVSKRTSPCIMSYVGSSVLQIKQPKFDTEPSSLFIARLKNASTTHPLSLTSSSVGV
jgi:hypothetical protein